jgi:hypothetical protein
MKNTADITGGKSIAFYLICECCKSFRRFLRHPWKKARVLGGKLFFFSGPDTIRETLLKSTMAKAEKQVGVPIESYLIKVCDCDMFYIKS